MKGPSQIIPLMLRRNIIKAVEHPRMGVFQGVSLGVECITRAWGLF
jgi:hypothetical protein